MAINWLLAGYAIDLRAKKITIVGKGRLVGAPLARMWQDSGYNVTVLGKSAGDITEIIKSSDVIVTATGVPGLISATMIPVGAVVVDAGTASEDGVIVGDISADVRGRDDLTITPEKGGVGPLTVAALFDNVITAASRVVKKDS
jgi:methylenetetrahydrofolate dehydrogenase (NADP+)/methenyltetrahydrofolate cyclohydrolase